MNPLDAVFVGVSVVLALAGLAMVGAALRAYVQTERRVMLHLSIGFTIIAAASLATVLTVVFNGFQYPQRLLVVNNGFSVFGYLFVIYSVVGFR